MHVCWGRLSFGVSVRACSQELNPTKSARIGDSVGNRADIHCSAASSSEVFQGLYGTNACPECFDSFWPSSVSTAGRGGVGNDCSYSRARDLPLCTSQTRLAVMQWCMVSDRQQGCLTHARPSIAPPTHQANTPPAVLSPQLPPPKVMDQPQPAMLS